MCDFRVGFHTKNDTFSTFLAAGMGDPCVGFRTEMTHIRPFHELGRRFQGLCHEVGRHGWLGWLAGWLAGWLGWVAGLRGCSNSSGYGSLSLSLSLQAPFARGQRARVRNTRPELSTESLVDDNVSVAHGQNDTP